SPEEDITYDAIMTSAEKSPLWKGSRAAVQQKIKTFAYDAAEGKETKADDMGISYEQYVTILLNLDKYDTPNKSGEYGGDPTNDEVTAALNHTTGYTRQELYNLWQELTGSDSDKNNPYRAQGSTVKKVKTEAKEQEKAEEKERGVTEIDTSYSSMFSGASYDPSTHTLKLKFRGSGKTYTYNVPESVWEDMKNADSLGNFYNSRIKGKYSAA
ncbi:MAG: KTSC domain-containing protein, partial [Ruminococcus sp.]|nr:KTSC domain-containing protein [Ruminococcus sp.]